MRFVVILVMCVVALAVRAERVYLLRGVEMRDTVVWQPLPTDALESSVEVRAAITGHRPGAGEGKCSWGVVWADGVRIELRAGNTAFGDAADTPYVRVTVLQGDSVICSRPVYDGVATHRSEGNTLVVTRTPAGMAVRVGHRALVPVCQLPVKGVPDEVGVFAHGLVTVAGAVVETVTDVAAMLATEWTVAALVERFEASTRPLEGFYEYFDRKNEPDYARPGGRYTLAVVADDDGPGYTLLYIDGAEVWADRWQEGMKKGHIIPTVFKNTFDGLWIDATMQAIDRDVNVTVEQDALLTVDFPVYKSRMRFVRMPRERWGR